MAKRKAKKAIRRTVGKGGNYRKTSKGAGMTKRGVRAYRKAARRRHPIHCVATRWTIRALRTPEGRETEDGRRTNPTSVLSSNARKRATAEVKNRRPGSRI